MAAESTETRPSWRSLAIPTEHGGWSFTLEPCLIALIAVPSVAGVTLTVAALIGFMSRTPLKVSLVDRFRRRRLARTRVADALVAIYALILLSLAAVAARAAEAAFWWPLALAAPLIATELWYDARSRGRRAIPELIGTVGIGAVGAMIVLAGGGDTATAAGVWIVVAARAISAVMFVRVQVRRLRGHTYQLVSTDSAQLVALGVAAVGVISGVVPILAAGAILAVAIVHTWLVRRPVPRVGVIGAQQIVIGLTLVLVAGLAFAAP